MWCVIAVNVVHFFHDLMAKISAFKSRGGQWFLNSLNYSRIFLVLEMYLKNVTYVSLAIKLLKIRSTETQRNIENPKENYFFPPQLKENLRNN